VEADNHSPDLVPVKAGFPYAAVARKWIQENFTTDDCDPGVIMDDIKKEEQGQAGTPDQSTQTQGSGTTATTTTPVKTSSEYVPEYKKNTTFSFGVLFHNLSSVLPLDSDLPGIELTFEQLFGKKFYGGFGVHYNMLLAMVNDEGVAINNFKFPLIAGYRIHPRRGFFGFEMVFFINTKMNAISDENITFWGRVPTNTSFSIYPRVRLGGKVVNFEIGPEFWLSEVFENEEALFLLHMNLRFCF
jgi:hypothetical protein